MLACCLASKKNTCWQYSAKYYFLIFFFVCLFFFVSLFFPTRVVFQCYSSSLHTPRHSVATIFHIQGNIAQFFFPSETALHNNKDFIISIYSLWTHEWLLRISILLKIIGIFLHKIIWNIPILRSQYLNFKLLLDLKWLSTHLQRKWSCSLLKINALRAIK